MYEMNFKDKYESLNQCLRFSLFLVVLERKPTNFENTLVYSVVFVTKKKQNVLTTIFKLNLMTINYLQI